MSLDTLQGLTYERTRLFIEFDDDDLKAWIEEIRQDIGSLEGSIKDRATLAHLKGTKVEKDEDLTERDDWQRKWLRAIKKSPKRQEQ